MRVPARIFAPQPLLATVLAVLTVAPAAAAPGRDPSGTWLTGDGRARIKVERCGAKAAAVCGTVVWLRTPLTDAGRPRTDIKNPDPEKRARPVIGMPIMSDLAATDEGKFKGEIYNAEEGRNYDVSIGLQTANELNVQGCVLGFLCGSQTWTRVSDTTAATTAPIVLRPAPTTTGSTTPKTPAR